MRISIFKLKLWLAALFALPALAGDLNGTVSDPDDLGVPSAKVTLICIGLHKTAKTDDLGRFAFKNNFLIRECRLEVSHPGFSEFQENLKKGESHVRVKLRLALIRQLVVVSGQQEDPSGQLDYGFGSLSLSDNELRSVSNNTPDLIRYTKMLAGISAGLPELVYVDGLPAALPPAEMISRITVNGDPFSAEYADGDVTHIDVTTKKSDRTVRYSLGGLSFGNGVRNPLDPKLRSESNSGSGYLSGPVPRVPLTFSFHANLGSTLNQTPIEAVLPLTPDFQADRALHDSAVANRFASGSLDLDYSPGSDLRFHVGYQTSRFEGLNLGVGGLSITEAGIRSSSTDQEIRAVLTKTAERFDYQSGLLVQRKRSDAHANSDALGLTVAGDFVAGGASMTSSDTANTAWTWKNVFRSISTTNAWTTGIIISGSDNFSQETPNAAGVFQFPNMQAYLAAVAGQGDGTWFVTRGNGIVRYLGISAAPFVQKELFRSEKFSIRGGLRADYQSGYQTSLSPRLSMAGVLHGFVMRAGAGSFIHNIPSTLFVKVMETDGLHLQSFIVNNTSLGPTLPVLLGREEGTEIRSQLSVALTRPRELLLKSSVEKPLRKFTPGVEYTWTRERHLLGSRRLVDGENWMDLVESNRNAESFRIHARGGYTWRSQIFSAHYEWIRAYDDGSGLYAFPAEQDNLHAEWARSAGISPHNVSLMGLFKLPADISLTLIDTWRSSAPFDITTGLDPANDGLYTDRGGSQRNSGNGPHYNSLSLYASKRIQVPVSLTRSRSKLFVNLSVQGDNLLGNKNFTSFGSIVGSPTFGQPLAALPARSIRFSISFN